MLKLPLPLLFARRYLHSRKSLSVINIISRVSIFAVGVPVAAMIILLSVFNGFDGVVKGMHNNFDPDILITPERGKVIDSELIEYEKLLSINGVDEVSFYIEGDVLIEYRGSQIGGKLRGVDTLYDKVIPVKDIIIHGDYDLRFGDMEQTVVGQGIAYELGIRTALLHSLNVYVPRRGNISPLLPLDGFTSGRLLPAGVFSIDATTDRSYMFSTIDFARELFGYEDKVSGVAVKLTDNYDLKKASADIKEELGEGFKVLTRYEQKESVYRIMEYEKWAIFFISLLVLVIASFSIVGSLVMLIIDKRPDMSTIITMGGDTKLVRTIFINEGMLISSLGLIGGVVFGVLLCLLQQHFGFVKLAGQSFVINTYPVELRWHDVVVVIGATFAITWIITKFTVSKMIPKSSIRL